MTTDPTAARKERHDRIFRIFPPGTGAHYDEIVRFSTGGRDRQWKEALLDKIAAPRRVLDLACGTGILSSMLRSRYPEVEIVGVDINREYLAVARERASAIEDANSTFLLGPAEEVPLEGSFDLIMTCYLPKYADLPALVPRLVDRLEPGGFVIMHDFVFPQNRVIAHFWEQRFLELVEWARSDLPEAIGMFEALPEVIRESTWMEDLQRLFIENGMKNVGSDLIDSGQAGLVWGWKE